VCRGEVVLLVGDNGAGKSTLLHAATGRYPISAGKLHTSGEARPFFLTQVYRYRYRHIEDIVQIDIDI